MAKERQKKKIMDNRAREKLSGSIPPSSFIEEALHNVGREKKKKIMDKRAWKKSSESIPPFRLNGKALYNIAI